MFDPTRRVAAGVLTLVLATAGLVGGFGATAGAQSPVALRLGVFPNVTHATALVGLQSGLFEDELGAGVKLEPKLFNAGPTAITAILSGAVDASYIGPSPAINAWQQSDGELIRIVSGATSGGAFLIVKPGITKVAQLQGKKIATPQLGNTQDVALRAYLKKKGFKTDVSGGGAVTILPQSNATTLDAFKSGAIDGAWVPEPWATRLIDEAGGTVLVDEHDLWPGGQFVTTHLIVATKFLDEHPDVVKKLIAGQVAANKFLAEQRSVAERLVAQAIKQYTGEVVSPATITKAWDNLEFTNDPIASSLQKNARDAESVGLLERVDLKGIYALKLLNQVLKAAGEPTVSSSLSAVKRAA